MSVRKTNWFPRRRAISPSENPKIRGLDGVKNRAISWVVVQWEYHQVGDTTVYLIPVEYRAYWIKRHPRYEYQRNYPILWRKKEKKPLG